MKYLVIALKPEENEILVHQEFSSAEDNESFSLEDDVYLHFEDAEVRMEYEQQYFSLDTVLNQSRAAIDAEMEEEVDGIAEDGVTAIMRTTHKRYQVTEKDSLQDVMRYLQALHIAAEAEHTPEEGVFGQAQISHCIVAVAPGYDDSRPLHEVALSFFMLKPEDYLFAKSQQALTELEQKVAALEAQTHQKPGDPYAPRELKVEKTKACNALEAAQARLLEMVESDFVEFANPRRVKAQQVASPVESQSQPSMLLRRSSRGLFQRQSQGNDNNAPYVGKGKEEEDTYSLSM